MPSTAAAPARRWSGRRWPRSRGCSAGSRTSGHLCGGGTMANLEALWVARAARAGQGRRRVHAGALHARPHRRRARPGVRGASRAIGAGGWMRRRLRARLERGGVGTVVATLGHDGRRARSIRCGDVLALARAARLPRPRGRGVRRLLRPGREPRARRARGLRPARRGGLDRHRSAQARAPAVRLRLRALPRPVGRPLLQARLALHLLQLDGAPPGRDQPRVLAARARPRSRSGRRSGCCRSCAAASSPRAWRPAAARRSRSTQRLRADARFVTASSSPSSTSSSGRRRAPQRLGVLGARARASSTQAAAARPAPRAGTSCRSRSSTWRRPRSRGTRHDHVPALGPDEAGASRVDRPEIWRILVESADAALGA